MKKIGEHLTEKGLITEEAVRRALEIQNKTGSKIGSILQAEGMVSTYHFYKELAKFKGLEFVDLQKYDYNQNLMVKDEKDEYLEMQYLPFDYDGKIYYVATSSPSEELINYLHRKYVDIKLYITSPLDILWTLQKCFDKEYIYDAAELLHEQTPSYSSKFIFSNTAAKLVLAVLVFAFIYFLKNKNFLNVFLVVMNIFFFSSIASKLIFFINGIKKSKESDIKETDDSTLPIYSILVPLLNEKKKTIAHLIEALQKLNYPKEKLDIKFIVEISDYKTEEYIKDLRPNYNLQIIRVPDNYPKTKPKACNYALHFCKGEYVTIYDAEDKPEPDQLRKVLAKFAANPDLACVQARLNYYNREENILTKLFSIEYSSWFDYMLYGLQKLDLPIPLGGTSNHFKIATLRSILAWDPYNVTEDADLGIRMAFKGMKTEIVDSLTLEEAPISFSAWLKQRTRWIKGYLQTYIVHMRSPISMLRQLGIKKYLGFFIFIGAPGIIYFTVPIVTLIILYCIINDVYLSMPLTLLSYFNLAATILVNLYIACHVVKNNGWKNMIRATALFPFYWVLHCIASFFSIYQLMVKPHYWSKTEHGLSKFVP